MDVNELQYLQNKFKLKRKLQNEDGKRKCLDEHFDFKQHLQKYLPQCLIKICQDYATLKICQGCTNNVHALFDCTKCSLYFSRPSFYEFHGTITIIENENPFKRIYSNDENFQEILQLLANLYPNMHNVIFNIVDPFPTNSCTFQFSYHKDKSCRRCFLLYADFVARLGIIF